MSSNRFYTLLVIPEKTSKVKRIIVPAWLLKGTLVASVFISILVVLMVYDYWYVMREITVNKELKTENLKLRQQVQIYKSKMNTIENTVDRIKTFSTRLKVITNIEDRSQELQSMLKLPEASTNIEVPKPKEEIPPSDEAWFVKFSDATQSLEQILQDEYEQLADKKAFLSALPTRKPSLGYFTSGFGIRRSPYGGREKMHEGLDIANRVGTKVLAPADGQVTYAQSKPGYGQTLIIEHGYGLETWYAHVKKLLVNKGQKIRRGQLIALLGNSGRSTGPHLHYEVRVHGTPVDPLTYILEN